MSDKVSDKVSDKLNEKEKCFFNVLMTLAKQYDFVTTKVVAEAAGMPEATTRRYLAKFSKMGIIVSDGKNRSKKYYLKNTSTIEANP